MKKHTIVILSVIFSMCYCVTANAATLYGDLKTSHWAYESVNTMSEKGIVKGYQDGSFKPGNVVTYGEFIKMALIAATGEDVGNSTEGNWALNYYSKALELKYFTIADISKDDLDKNITRAKMALIISAALGDVKVDNALDLQKNITDINEQTVYKDAILKAYTSGILTGYTDKTFKPEQTLTRAEAATVMYRFVEPGKRVDNLNQTPIESKIDDPITITSGGKQIVVDKDSVSLPFRDIVSITKGDKWIQVKSKVVQDFMLYAGTKSIAAVGNVDGTDYFCHDGYYFYYFNPYEYALAGKDIYLRFASDENQKMYLVKGVKL